jgi:hypothetical protein
MGELDAAVSSDLGLTLGELMAGQGEAGAVGGEARVAVS